MYWLAETHRSLPLQHLQEKWFKIHQFGAYGDFIKHSYRIEYKSTVFVLVSLGLLQLIPQARWLKTTEFYSLTVPEARGPKSRSQQLLQGSREKSPSYLFGVPWLPTILGFQLHLCFGHHRSWPCVSSPLFVRTLIILDSGLKLLQYNLLLTNSIFEESISEWYHIQRFWEQYQFGEEDTTQLGYISILYITCTCICI